jgi:hypothetical protein
MPNRPPNRVSLGVNFFLDFYPERYMDHQESAAQSALRPDANERDHFACKPGRFLCRTVHFS